MVPLISVVICTYQHGQFIGACVESVLAQTYPNFEVIVVDDGSTDNTPEILATFRDRIRVIRQENRGLSTARNVGIFAAEGDWVAFQDADDLWIPDKLANQAHLLSNLNTGLVFCDVFFWDGKNTSQKTSFQLYPPSAGKIYQRLFIQNFILVNSVIVRKSALNQVGLFDPSLTSCEDYDIWLHIACDWDIVFLNQPCVYYRMHHGQMIKNQERMLLNLVNVKERHFIANKDLLTGLSKRELDRGFYNNYLKLAKLYIQQRKADAAYGWLEKFSHSRGKTVLYWIFTFIAKMPGAFVQPALNLFDRVHYRRDVGQW